MSPGISEEAGQTARSVVDTFKAQPGLLFLTLVNLSFLGFVYGGGLLVLDAYNKQQEQMHQRYNHTIELVDRCIIAAFNSMPATDRAILSVPDREDTGARPDEGAIDNR